MTMWDLTLHRAATGTVENLCACPHHDLNFFITREVEYLVLAHGPVKRTFPGVGNSDTQIITNFSFEDGTSVYFNATKIESDDQQPAPFHDKVWQRMVRKSDEAHRTLTAGQILSESMPRKKWSDPEFDKIGIAAEASSYNSTPIAMPLSRHLSEIRTDGRMIRARAEVWVSQSLRDAEPSVQFNRWARVDGITKVVRGSHFNLTLAEATELANKLLLAVEVAREGTEQEVAL